MNTVPTSGPRTCIRPSTPPWRHGAGRLAIALVILGFAFSAGAQVPAPLTEEDDRVRGNRQAPLTLLEYSDFTCGYCEKFFQETWPMLFSEYVQTGKLRLVYRDFPRASIGAGVDTALAARCAGEQGQYWAMHDRLFSGQSKFSPAQLRQQAEELPINIQRFVACFEESRYTKDIFADVIEAGKLGLRGTPGFVLSVTKNPQEAVIIPGAFPYETFKEEIDKLLKIASAPQRSSTDAGNPPGRTQAAASVPAESPPT